MFDRWRCHESSYRSSYASSKGAFVLFKQLIHLGYYLPTMQVDVVSFIRRCYTCQLIHWILRFINPSVVPYLGTLVYWSYQSVISRSYLNPNCNRMLHYVGRDNILKWASGATLLNFIQDNFNFSILAFLSLYSLTISLILLICICEDYLIMASIMLNSVFTTLRGMVR